MPKTVRQTPRAKDLAGVLEACERHIRNKAFEYADLIDNEDGTPDDFRVILQTKKNWQELADDVREIIRKESKKK